MCGPAHAACGHSMCPLPWKCLGSNFWGLANHDCFFQPFPCKTPVKIWGVLPPMQGSHDHRGTQGNKSIIILRFPYQSGHQIRLFSVSHHHVMAVERKHSSCRCRRRFTKHKHSTLLQRGSHGHARWRAPSYSPPHAAHDDHHETETSYHARHAVDIGVSST